MRFPAQVSQRHNVTSTVPEGDRHSSQASCQLVVPLLVEGSHVTNESRTSDRDILPGRPSTITCRTPECTAASNAVISVRSGTWEEGTEEGERLTMPSIVPGPEYELLKV